MARHVLQVRRPGLKLGIQPTERIQMNTMFLKMYLKLQDLMNREEGQDLVEYALVIALISVAAIASLQVLATAITKVFNGIATDL